MQTMTGLVNEETWTPMEGAEGQRVLKSASSLFAALKKSLGQCSNNVSKGAPMLQLLNSFQVLDASARLGSKRCVYIAWACGRPGQRVLPAVCRLHAGPAQAARELPACK